MGLTEQQRERRRKYVGASDVAAIMGVDPYRSPSDVWAEKVYGTADLASEPARLGNHLEAACVTLAMEELGGWFSVSRQNAFRVRSGTRLGVNLDAWLVRHGGSDAPIPLECKTAGILNPWGDALAAWGEAGTDQIPEGFILQLHAQMLCVGSSESYLSAIVAGRGHLLYRCELNADLAGAILETVAAFWEHVEAGQQPEDDFLSPEVLRRVIRRAASVCDLSETAEAIVAWREAAAAAKAAAEAEEAAKTRVLALLGDCEAGLVASGYSEEQAVRLAAALGVDADKAAAKSAVTYYEQGRKSVDVDRLRRDHPAVYEACVAESRFRVLRLAAPKKGMAVNSSPRPLPAAEVAEG